MGHDPVAQILEDPRFRGAPITWNVTPQGYEKIRHDWLAHVSAEEELFRPYTEDLLAVLLLELPACARAAAETLPPSRCGPLTARCSPARPATPTARSCPRKVTVRPR